MVAYDVYVGWAEAPFAEAQQGVPRLLGFAALSPTYITEYVIPAKAGIQFFQLQRAPGSPLSRG
jgi:hypothetical protein